MCSEQSTAPVCHIVQGSLEPLQLLGTMRGAGQVRLMDTAGNNKTLGPGACQPLQLSWSPVPWSSFQPTPRPTGPPGTSHWLYLKQYSHEFLKSRVQVLTLHCCTWPSPLGLSSPQARMEWWVGCCGGCHPWQPACRMAFSPPLQGELKWPAAGGGCP